MRRWNSFYFCHPERRAQTGSPASTGFVLAGVLQRGVEGPLWSLAILILCRKAATLGFLAAIGVLRLATLAQDDRQKSRMPRPSFFCSGGDSYGVADVVEFERHLPHPNVEKRDVRMGHAARCVIALGQLHIM